LSIVRREAAILAVQANLWELHRDFVRVPGAEVHDDPGLLWFTMASPSGWLNGASRTDLSPFAADRAIRTIVDTMRPLGKNVLWHLGPAARPVDLPVRLVDAGFHAVSPAAPGMAVSLSEASRPPSPVGLGVAAVTTEEELIDWLHTFSRSFEREPQGRQHVWFGPFGHLGLTADGPCRLFVARVDGSPVACSLGFVGAGAVGLYGVGTVPEMRGRGYGSAVTLAAMDWGAERGAALAILHATELGEPVYRRLGFETVCLTSQWGLRAS
jgi:GNAT superfamily N-acetyltransferase